MLGEGARERGRGITQQGSKEAEWMNARRCRWHRCVCGAVAPVLGRWLATVCIGDLGCWTESGGSGVTGYGGTVDL